MVVMTDERCLMTSKVMTGDTALMQVVLTVILFQRIHPVVFISTEFQSASLYNNAICKGTVISFPVTQEASYELMHGINIYTLSTCSF